MGKIGFIGLGIMGRPMAKNLHTICHLNQSNIPDMDMLPAGFVSKNWHTITGIKPRMNLTRK